MNLPHDVLPAVVLVTQLQEWLDQRVDCATPQENRFWPKDIPVASFTWSHCTLSISIEDVCVWDDNGDDEMTFDNCITAYLAYTKKLVSIFAKELT